MPALTPEQGESLIERGAELLNDAARLTSGSDPDYIRDANPESLFEAIPLAAARQGCRRYAEKGGDYPARRAARAERACRPYLDSLEYGEGPQIDLPFRGGQCGGINYTVTLGITEYPFDDCSTFGEGVSSNGYAGPIRGLRFAVVSPSGPLCTPGRNRAYLQHGAPGNETLVGGAGYGVDVRIISIVPEGGAPDNCGNPTPEYRPPTAPAIPDPPGPVPFVRSPDIDIDIDVEVNIDGSLTIDIGTGPITVDPFDEPGGEPGGGGDGGDPGDPTDPGAPGDPEGTGPGGDAEGMAPEGQELVGLLVTVSGAPGDANKFANNSKQPYRGIGYVRMGYPGRLGLDISGGTVISPQFFHAQQRGLTNWAVAANIGFDLTIQPYYRDIET